MTKNATFIAAALFVALASASTLGAPADTQPNHLMIPQSIRYEHASILDRLTKEAARPGPAAAVAGRILGVMKAHFAKEEEFVFPPLGLLDQITAGEMPSVQISRMAIDMANRTKVAGQELNQEHIRLTAMMDELIQAAKQSDEAPLIAFATDLAAHSLQEIEILQPTTIMIGEYLQSKLRSDR